jgi:hypothetical protein
MFNPGYSSCAGCHVNDATDDAISANYVNIIIHARTQGVSTGRVLSKTVH